MLFNLSLLLVHEAPLPTASIHVFPKDHKYRLAGSADDVLWPGNREEITDPFMGQTLAKWANSCGRSQKSPSWHQLKRTWSRIHWSTPLLRHTQTRLSDAFNLKLFRQNKNQNQLRHSDCLSQALRFTQNCWLFSWMPLLATPCSLPAYLVGSLPPS